MDRVQFLRRNEQEKKTRGVANNREGNLNVEKGKCAYKTAEEVFHDRLCRGFVRETLTATGEYLTSRESIEGTMMNNEDLLSRKCFDPLVKYTV